MTKIAGFTIAQWLVALATLGGAFLVNVQPELISLGVSQPVMDIAGKLLTLLVGVGLFLKTGDAGPSSASIG